MDSREKRSTYSQLNQLLNQSNEPVDANSFEISIDDPDAKSPKTIISSNSTQFLENKRTLLINVMNIVDPLAPIPEKFPELTGYKDNPKKIKSFEELIKQFNGVPRHRQNLFSHSLEVTNILPNIFFTSHYKTNY